MAIRITNKQLTYSVDENTDFVAYFNIDTEEVVGTVTASLFDSSGQFTLTEDTATQNRWVLRYNTPPNYEANPSPVGLTVHYTFVPDDGGAPSFDFSSFTVTVADVDEAPTTMTVTPVITDVNEANITDAGDRVMARKLADVTFADDASGTNAVTVAESDIFEIRDGTELWLKEGAPLDYETATGHTVTLTPDVTGSVASNASQLAAQTFTLNVLDVLEPPNISSAGTARIAENSAADTIVYQTEIANFTGNNAITYSLSGTHASKFSIDSNTGAVQLLAPADYETQPSYSFTVTATDGAASPNTQTAVKTVILAVTNVDEAPTVTITPVTDSQGNPIPLSEGSHETDYAIADITIIDPDGAFDPNPVFALTGYKAESFYIGGTQASGFQLMLRGTHLLDYEDPPALTLSVTTRSFVNGDWQAGMTTTRSISIDIIDVVEQPGDITITTLTNEVPEDTTEATKLAIIHFTNNASGSYDLSIPPGTILNSGPGRTAQEIYISEPMHRLTSEPIPDMALRCR